MCFTRRKLLVAFVLVSASGPALAGPWDFEGQAELTKGKIETFLDRAVVHFDTASFNGFNAAEWARTRQFLLDTGAKFIHGGELSWGKSYPNHSYWDQCAARLADLHATPGLEDVIVEGFIAEHISSNADSTLIPDWLWTYMEQEGIAATRTPSPNDHDGLHYFHYNNFFDEEWLHINYWGAGASVPDIRQMETRLYYRYLLREYIDAGFESIWFGGILLTGALDGNNAGLKELTDYARDYAAQHGRRHAVLFTSHVAGRTHNGQELLDYSCFPTRMRYTETYPSGLEINPALPDDSVWDLIPILEGASDLPVLLEIDNYACVPSPPIFRGHYDEISGFASKSPAQRGAFLKQYYYEVRHWKNIWCNQRVHLAMPGRRNICTGTCEDANNSNPAIPYPGGMYSPYAEHCGEEATIAGLFDGSIPPPAAAAAAVTEAPEQTGSPGVIGPWLAESFDGYIDGTVAGQGGWTEDLNRGSAIVQSAFTPGGGGKALRLDAFAGGVQIDNKLSVASQTGGKRRIHMDVAYTDLRLPGAGPPGTLMRIGFRAALPNVNLVPGGTLFFLYWGTPARIVYQGNQSANILANPQSGQWYHVELVLDLDALTLDVVLDGVTVLANLPMRQCESHSFGSIAVTGFAIPSVPSYLDNLTGVDCQMSAPYAGQDCDADGVADECEDNADGDEVVDDCDTCPDLHDLDQTDTDRDGVGDACDNCVDASNPEQMNTDGDGPGNACDEDDDNDGVIDGSDNCPLAANVSQDDRDADGFGDACDACPDTIPGVSVDATGCTPPLAADFNSDGDVDQSDFAFLQRCLSGDAVTPGAGCLLADLDADSDVDGSDFSRFLPCVSGADLPANPGCLP